MGNDIIFIDNDAFPCAITRESSTVEIADELLAALRGFIAFPDIRLWRGAVSSAGNPADSHSLGPPIDFSDDKYRSFRCENGRNELTASIRHNRFITPLPPIPV